MISLLLISPDLKLAQELSQFSEGLNIRVRSVTGVNDALQWLAMQGFDVILVDSDAEPARYLEILETAWKHTPCSVGGLFSRLPQPQDHWTATLIGAKVFLGSQAITKIKDFLKSLPQKTEIARAKYDAVLFVEDLDSPREIVSSYIQNLGFKNTDAVSNAKEALLALRNAPEKYFCVLTDIHMPEMNGIELVREIRNDEQLRYLPVIMLTADPSEENLVECIKAGASGFLAKPPKKKALLRELEKAQRLVLYRQSPRLCEPKDAHLLQDALQRAKPL